MLHGGSFQYDSRAPSCVISIGFTPIEGMPFQGVLAALDYHIYKLSPHNTILSPTGMSMKIICIYIYITHIQGDINRNCGNSCSKNCLKIKNKAAAVRIDNGNNVIQKKKNTKSCNTNSKCQS